MNCVCVWVSLFSSRTLTLLHFLLCFATCIIYYTRARARSFPLFAFFSVFYCAGRESARAANLLFAQTYEMHTRSVESISSGDGTTTSTRSNFFHYIIMIWYFLRLFSEWYLLRSRVWSPVCVWVVVFCLAPTKWRNRKQKVDAMHETISFAKHTSEYFIFFAMHSIENCWFFARGSWWK